MVVTFDPDYHPSTITVPLFHYYYLKQTTITTAVYVSNTCLESAEERRTTRRYALQGVPVLFFGGVFLGLGAGGNAESSGSGLGRLMRYSENQYKGSVAIVFSSRGYLYTH